jgi:nucleoside-diphosphate kinase
MEEKTLVLLKPDAIARRIGWEILDYFLRRSGEIGNELSIIRMSVIGFPSEEQMARQYPAPEPYLLSLAEKSGRSFGSLEEKKAYGMEVVKRQRAFMMSGEICAIVFKGEEAIKVVRKITGATNPSLADKDTVRGKWGEDDLIKANEEGRATRNLVHASGNIEEARREIGIWFPEMAV